jgi:NTE family protein
MRIGLVLGGGGVVGASWLIGALEALSSETGWDPSSAEFIVGTSAGSVVGSLCAVGLSPEHMSAYSTGRPMDEFADVEALAGQVSGLAEALEEDGSEASEYRLARALPSIGPGSWRMAVSTLRHPTRHAASALLSAWLPRGMISTDPIRDLVERFVPGQWPEHPNYWAVACDYGTGRRVAFGRADAPPAPVGAAVAASCAIPAFYQPVKIGQSQYIDGGVCSPSNLDLLCGRDLDLVVCLNPTSSLSRLAVRSPAEGMAASMRRASGRRLGHEARKLRAEGTHVLLLQPNGADLQTMGPNLMARDRRVPVMEQAVVSTAQELRSLRATGHPMPKPKRTRRAAPQPVAAVAPAAPPAPGRPARPARARRAA